MCTPNRQVKTSAESLLVLINDILDLTKVPRATTAYTHTQLLRERGGRAVCQRWRGGVLDDLTKVPSLLFFITLKPRVD